MPIVARRHPLFAVAASVVVCLVAAPAAIAAEDKAKSTQSEGKWIKFDSAANTVTIKITKEGKGAKPPEALKVKKGRDAVFKVKPTGSVLTKTSVAINGKKGDITDIPEGKTVNVYWIPDESDPKSRFARKIDVILSDEELDAKYGVDKIEAE
jgi:hypothetical protein